MTSLQAQELAFQPAAAPTGAYLVGTTPAKLIQLAAPTASPAPYAAWRRVFEMKAV